MPLKSNIARFSRRIGKLLPDARSNAAKAVKEIVVDVIVEEITSGSSPVDGQNRYPKYSPKYAKEKGRQQPVDLVKSGAMLENLRARLTNKDSVILEFPSKEQRDKATGHQTGANGLPVRKILPVGKGEKFKNKVLAKIIKAAQKSLDETIKKAN